MISSPRSIESEGKRQRASWQSSFERTVGARFLLFQLPEMKTLARRLSENDLVASEIESLRRALDKSYTQLREKARAEWQRRCVGRDPSDACVHVRIRPNGQSQALTS
jgi:hypothetical protein